MLNLGTLREAENKVWTDVQSVVSALQTLCAVEVANAADGVMLLKKVRSQVYEDLNQIQHEHLILCAARWLVENRRVGPDVVWQWNPRQTGDASEPDLRGTLRQDTVISAEVTTSSKPIGSIDGRMAKTLEKMSVMPGEKFYFVRSIEMRTRAETKVAKRGLKVEVVLLDMPVDVLEASLEVIEANSHT